MASKNGMIPFTPSYLMYSKAPKGWHDEPFEYVFSWSIFATLTVEVTSTTFFDFFNNPLQFDPDADFFLRGAAVLVDNTPGPGLETDQIQLRFNMRLRNAYGRALDNGFIPMQSYFTSPQNLNNAAFGPEPGSPVATPWLPELYCPSNGAMFADFQCQPIGLPLIVGTPYNYSFHLYFQGVKRFQNEVCKPGNSESTKVGQAA
jgi:hypothetical protein